MPSRTILTGNLYCIKDINNPHRFLDNGPMYIAASSNIYDNTKGKQDTDADGAEVNTPRSWVPPYSYTLDNAQNVPDLVKRSDLDWSVGEVGSSHSIRHDFFDLHHK